MKRCMFVDGSSVIRKVAKRILSGPDMTVIEASTGVEAMEICSFEMPELIVVDSGLPDMPATEFIRRIRSSAGQTQPRLLISLVELDVGAIMRAKRAGADGYLMKPFNRPQLLERFRTLQAAA